MSTLTLITAKELEREIKKRPISLDLEKHENFIAAVIRKGEMLATSKVKMSRIKKKKKRT